MYSSHRERERHEAINSIYCPYKEMTGKRNIAKNRQQAKNFLRCVTIELKNIFFPFFFLFWCGFGAQIELSINEIQSTAQRVKN